MNFFCYFLGVVVTALLSTNLADASIYSFYPGRAVYGFRNISEWLNSPEGKEDRFARANNTVCAPIRYSVNPFRQWLPEGVAEHSQEVLDRYLTNIVVGHLVTANHHGKPHHFTLSGMNMPYLFIDHQPLSGFRVCVLHESYEFGLNMEPELFPDVHVDWVTYVSFWTHNRDTASFRQLLQPSLTRPDCNSVHRYGDEFVAVLASVHIVPDLHKEMQPVPIAVWLDALAHDGFQSRIRICATIANISTFEYIGYALNASFVGVEDGVNSINAGITIPGQYSTEYFNAKLLEPGHSTNWRVLCADIPYTVPFHSTPHIFVSPSYRQKMGTVQIEPAVTAWVEFKNEVGFRGCVGKPYFSAEQASEETYEPHLEYVIISVDGIYNEQLDISKGREYLILTELKFPVHKDLDKFFADYIQESRLLSGYFSFLLNQLNLRVQFSRFQFHDHGFLLDKEHNSVYTYLSFQENANNPYTGATLASYLDQIFEEEIGRIRYLNKTRDRGVDRFMELLYDTPPNNNQTLDLVMINLKHGTDCILGEFDSGDCSVKTCGASHDGVKTITRTRIDGTDELCPPKTHTIGCNYPPCTMKRHIFEIDADSRGKNLTWLLVILIFFFIGAAAFVGYYFYKNRTFSGILHRSRKSELL